MVRQIVWSAEALTDLHEIKGYISTQSPANAEKIVRAIERAADNLADFPLSHRVVPEWGHDERRETFVYKWRLMFRILPEQLRIVGVIHGARLLDNVDPSRSFEEAPQQDYVAS